MSILKTIYLQHLNGGSPNATLDANGNMTVTGTVAGAYSDMFRNRIINGDMRIDERNDGASLTTNGAYCLDRWYFETSNSGNDSVQQVADAPAGFYNSLKVTNTTGASIAAGSYLDLVQKIEGFNCFDFAYGTASAKPITVSFWVKSSITGTYSVNLRLPLASTAVGSVQTYTINLANTWEYKTVTFTGNTTYPITAANTGQLSLYFFLASGSTYQTSSVDSWVTTGSGFVSSSSQTNGMFTTSGATFNITGVQLEPGTSATPFERRAYGHELALCQRYYYRAPTSGTFTLSGFSISTTVANLSTTFPVVMRTNPSALEQSGTASNYTIRDRGGNKTCTAVPAFLYGSTNSGAITMTTTGLTQGDGAIGYNNTAAGYLAWSAEL